jgi:TolB-like protein
MSDDHKAIFLSYASQDSEAAKRICESLRQAGIEVWFDQSELVGGDAWDAKIRRQIASCTLFVPVISANTQARLEGYFRLEWKLAAQRTHTMAEEKTFLLPVVIDDTRDADAKVPAEFKAVQWTRLPRGETTAAFVNRGKTLLIGKVDGDLRAPSIDAPQSNAPGGRVPPRTKWALAALGTLVLGLIAFITLRPQSKEPATTLPAGDRAESKPAAADKSIAVLPFENLSTDKENGFFADGVHEDVLTALQNIRELRVLSRTTMMQYRERGQKSLPQIARELGVTYVLEGSVQRAGDKVRVRAQLIDARTDAHLWALPAGEHDLTNIFAVQAQLASAIASQLKATISPQEKTLIERRPTQNAAAYDLFLKAREVMNQPRANYEHLQNAVSLFEAAVRLDQKFAEAWVALSLVNGRIYFLNMDHTPGRLESTKTALDRGIALTPDTPEALQAAGYYYFGGFRDFPRALTYWEPALRARPNFPDLLSNLGGLKRRSGRWNEALAHFRQATEFDPGNLVVARNLALTFEAGRRYDEAAIEHRRMHRFVPEDIGVMLAPALMAFLKTGTDTEMKHGLARLTQAQAESADGLRARILWAFLSGDLATYLKIEKQIPSEPTTVRDFRGLRAFETAQAMAAAGDLEGSRSRADAEQLRRRLVNEPENDALWRALARGEALLGHKDEALRCARKADELIPESLDSFVANDNRRTLAFVYAWTGDKDRALAEYARLLRMPSGLNVHEMRRSPEFFPLQGEPRFEALLNDPKNNAPLF